MFISAYSLWKLSSTKGVYPNIRFFSGLNRDEVLTRLSFVYVLSILCAMHSDLDLQFRQEVVLSGMLRALRQLFLKQYF